MATALVRYLEPLAADERAFLMRREAKERHQLFKAFSTLMPICFIVPFATAWGNALLGVPNPFSYSGYFSGVAILLLLTFGGMAVAYRSSLYLLRLDLHHNTKTIERVTITRKYFMRQTNTCHFYLDSRIKLSVEVSADFFERLAEGDELNIEYATHSKIYFGYF